MPTDHTELFQSQNLKHTYIFFFGLTNTAVQLQHESIRNWLQKIQPKCLMYMKVEVGDIKFYI